MAGAVVASAIFIVQIFGSSSLIGRSEFAIDQAETGSGLRARTA